MTARYRLFRRRQGVYYVFDKVEKKQTSLKTKDADEASRLLHAKNEACREAISNFKMAQIYLQASDAEARTRTWADAFSAMIATKHGATRDRWERAARQKAFRPLLSRVLIETQAEHLLAVLRAGTVSTNTHLRKLHNFCLDLNWIPWPILPKKQWPAVRFGEKRAITREEHHLIVQAEGNPEYRAFYSLAWHLGASQSDLAKLCAEDIDWEDRVIALQRRKTQQVALVRFGQEVEQVLRTLPRTGSLFPHFARFREKHRAKEFRRRCQSVGVSGVSLHSYRYAWAERAKQAGYPERFAQQALGHNSKAVHRAYARKAIVKIPPLEEFESGALPPETGALM